MILGRFLPLGKIKPYLARPEQLVVALFVFIGAGHIPHDSPWGLVGKTFLAVLLIQMTSPGARSWGRTSGFDLLVVNRILFCEKKLRANTGFFPFP